MRGVRSRRLLAIAALLVGCVTEEPTPEPRLEPHRYAFSIVDLAPLGSFFGFELGPSGQVDGGAVRVPPEDRLHCRGDLAATEWDAFTAALLTARVLDRGDTPTCGIIDGGTYRLCTTPADAAEHCFVHSAACDTGPEVGEVFRIARSVLLRIDAEVGCGPDEYRPPR